MTDSFSGLLQFSISPIVLISAASLLLLSITNRLGRTIDRSRILVRELDNGSRFSDENRGQLRILIQRSHYLRKAVLCTTVSIFLAALIVLSVLLHGFFAWPLRSAILGLLFLSIFLLCPAVAFLFLDVTLGLKALRLEVDRHLKDESRLT